MRCLDCGSHLETDIFSQQPLVWPQHQEVWWCHLGQTPSSAQHVILGVHALSYNPDTGQLLWRAWAQVSSDFQWAGDPSADLLSPFHRIFVTTWCVVWFTAQDSWRLHFPVWPHWWSWVDCRGSCDHREELQVSHSQFQDYNSLTIARKEKKRKKFSFVFKNLCTSAYGFWLKIGSIRRTNQSMTSEMI